MSGPYPDPDIRDPNEGQRPEATEVSRSGVCIRVKRGSFNDGWTEVITTLAETLSDEQMSLLMVRFEQLSNRGPR